MQMLSFLIAQTYSPVVMCSGTVTLTIFYCLDRVKTKCYQTSQLNVTGKFAVLGVFLFFCTMLAQKANLQKECCIHKDTAVPNLAPFRFSVARKIETTYSEIGNRGTIVTQNVEVLLLSFLCRRLGAPHMMPEPDCGVCRHPALSAFIIYRIHKVPSGKTHTCTCCVCTENNLQRPSRWLIKWIVLNITAALIKMLEIS